MEKFRTSAKRLFTSTRESETYGNPSVSSPSLIQTEPATVESSKLCEQAINDKDEVWSGDSVSTTLALVTRIPTVVDEKGGNFADFDVGNKNCETSSDNGKINEQRRQKESSCRKRRLLRSFTLASIPSTFEKTTKMFQLAKAPLKVKFLVSPKGAAWFLEEDVERSSLGCDTNTDSTPFSYNTSQTYYSSAPCSPNYGAMTRKKKTNSDITQRPSISLENLNRLRVSPSKLTLDEPDLNEGNEQEDEDQRNNSAELRGPLRRSFSFTQRNVRRNAVIEPPSEGLSVKTKRKRDNVLEAFFKSVERQDEEQVKKLLDTNDIEVNEFNDDGFTALDVSLMLHAEVITGHLLEHEARESNRFSAIVLLEKHLTMLHTTAEDQVQSFVSDVLNKGSTDAKDSEKQLKECEWRLHLLETMLHGFKEIELPGCPNSVLLSAASETSLLVRFSGPASGKVNPVTKFRVQWSRDKDFDKLDGEYFSHNILNRQYTVTGLQKSIAYYVRVCAGNIKGYGALMMSTPPCVVPSSWHELDDSIPRFQGKLDRIAKLFQEVQVHQMNSRPSSRGESKSFRLRRSPQLLRKRASSWHVAAGNDVKYDRKDSKKRSFTKYAKLLTSTPKFVKELKRGIYLSTLFYTKDDKVLVTLDENLPLVEVDDTSPSSFMQEFQWLLKVGCTWHDVRMLKEQVERNLSSTSVFLRARLLQALDTLQSGVGCNDLGQLHYRIIKDKNGTNIIVITKRIKNPSFIKSRTLSMKWFSLSKLQKKMAQKESEDSESAISQIVTSIQEVISYHQQTKKPLDRGLYLGFLKLRTSMDAIHVTVPRYSPNILPHVKVRDNPHVSREEWEWLTGLTAVPDDELGVESSPDFQAVLENAVKNLLDDIDMSRQEYSNCRIYDREVVELSNDVSLLILIPAPEHVCSCPGDAEDIFTDNEKFISIPVPAFEMNLMRTYQNQFICHYSRLSSILEMASLISQQESRKAILETEIVEARKIQDKLNTFQKELDEVWKGMRWLLDTLHYARDRESVSGIPLDMLFDTRRPSSPEPYDSHRKHPERKINLGNGSTDSGVLKIFSACETGLAPGKCVKLHVTPCTTVQQVVRLVVRQFEKLVTQKKPLTKPLSEEKLKEFCLVAVIGANERCLKDDYKILQLQNPWTKGKLFVRLRVEAVAADNSSPSTSV